LSSGSFDDFHFVAVFVGDRVLVIGALVDFCFAAVFVGAFFDDAFFFAGAFSQRGSELASRFFVDAPFFKEGFPFDVFSAVFIMVIVVALGRVW